MTEPQNVRLFSRKICRSLGDRLSMVEHVQALGYLPAGGHLRIAISRTENRAIYGADSIHKGVGKMFSLLQSLPFAATQSSLSWTVCSFLSVPAVFSLSKAIAVLIPLIPPLHTRGILCSRVYFEFRVSDSRNGCPLSNFGCPPVLDALQFWMPSSFGCPRPILAPLLLAQCWPPVSSRDSKFEDKSIIK